MPSPRHDFLAGGGEMGERMRAMDWTATPLGPPQKWPLALKTAVRIMLTSAQPIWLGWGEDLTYLYNDPYQSIIGGKHPQALGKPFREVWSEIWDVVGPMADRVMNRDEGIYLEAQLLIMERHGYQEETYYTFSYSPVPNDDGGRGGLICANTDNTRRVIGERQLASLRELAAATAHCRDAAEACTVAIESLSANRHDVPFALLYLAEAGGGCRLAAQSAGAEALLDSGRWPCVEVMKANQGRVVALEPAPPGVPKGAWPRAPSRAAVMPIEGPGQAERTGVLVVGLSPFREYDENYRGFLELAARQVAAGLANAEAHEQERKRAESLAAIDRAKTEFFSNVSHEFRTPLTLMLGPLEDALAGELPAAGRERIETASRNARRLLKLVNSLLDFSRIEAGRVEGAFQATDLSALTTELASHFESAVQRAGLRLAVQAPPLGEAVYVDREMWEKIVFNLLSNAFKFTFEGEIALSLRREAGRAVLEVRDTGTGIPAAELAQVFQRFHRVEGARGRSLEGSGIGLSLVQELVRLHMGEVSVQSEPGRGSTFRVSLPLGSAHLPKARPGAAPAPASGLRGAAYVVEILSWLPEDADRTPPPRSPAEPGRQRPRILLADDNADMRTYVRRLLGRDYEVVAVTDGAGALEQARRQRFDLVLSDAMMPRLDGFGLIAALRADPATRTLPVILLSARAGEESRVEGMAAGADDYLVKPFSAKELQARVAARLEIARIRREAEAATREEAQALQTLNRIGMTLAAELDLERIVQAVTDAATAVSGAQFGAFFYNVVNDKGESYQLYTISGAPREAFEKFGMPRNTAVFAATFVGAGMVRVDDITKDPRYGRNAPHQGMPKGHLPVRSYLAAPVMSRAGEVVGGLFFGHPQPGIFTERAERLVEGIAAQAAVAFDKAQLYEQRLQLIGELQQADRRKDEFLATLSHELRNPLAPLRNSLHLLRAAGGGGAAAPIHDMMERQVNHLVRLVDDLLETSRISRGAFDLKKERVELGEAVRNAVETSQPLIQAAGHELRLDLPGAPLWIEGDPVRLAQILANLLNNAARYTDPGGRISLSAALAGGAVKISVRDNGTGIAPEAQPRLFEMFSRESRSSGRNQGGLGIGLALARRLAEMHGGGIEAKSDGPGKGAEFIVTLPLATEQRPAEAAGAPRGAALKPRRILVVDDNHDAAESLSMVLKFLGADVRVARDGPEALAAFEAYDPAVVLLDIGLPGMDGYEVARRIRSGFPSRRAALVALTGWGQDKDRREAREAGFDQHLIKPAEIGALQALLASLETDHRAERPISAR
jgi:signal transduction histidine kinase/DNA-binding response OmpR family regulator